MRGVKAVSHINRNGMECGNSDTPNNSKTLRTPAALHVFSRNSCPAVYAYRIQLPDDFNPVTTPPGNNMDR